MLAPKRPVSTLSPSSRSDVQNRSKSGLACSGRAASEKLGRFPLRVSAISVNWLTARTAPPASVTLRSNFPASSSKMRRRAILPASASASPCPSPSATPTRTSRPAPIWPTVSPATVTRARVTRWTTARMEGTLGSVTDDADRRDHQLWSLARQSLVALVAVGALLAFVDGTAGAALVFVGLGSLVAAQLTIAFRHYRRVMARPWPA